MATALHVLHGTPKHQLQNQQREVSTVTVWFLCRHTWDLVMTFRPSNLPTFRPFGIPTFLLSIVSMDVTREVQKCYVKR
jgi:hypothetical protein